MKQYNKARKIISTLRPGFLDSSHG